MRKILICSSAIPNDIEEKITFNSSAANRFIHNIANNIVNYSVNYFSYLTYPANEKEKSAILNSIKKQDNYQVFFKCEHLWQFIKIWKYLFKAIKSSDIVLVYNMNYIYWAVSLLSKVLRKKTALIIADYIEPREIRSIPRKAYQALNWIFMKKFKKIIVLSKELKEKINGSLLFEGAVDPNIYNSITEPQKTEKLLCYYGGALDYVTGVDMLLDIFQKLHKNNIHFIVSGKGVLEDKVSEYSRTYSNFEYVGYVSFEHYVKLLNKANVLLNPRNMNMPQNKNNFPSKFFDYLASGRSIISTKFPGYSQHLENAIFVENDISLIADELIKKLNITQKEISTQFEINRKKAANYFWNKKVQIIIDFIMTN